MQPFRHILVGTDFGPSSARAVYLAAELARARAAKLTLVHVLEPHTAEPEVLIPLTSEAIPGEWRRAAQERLVSFAREQGVTEPYETAVRFGEPWKAIVGEAEGTDVDLVVLGTHGRRGPARLLLGSVAERVVRECPCPVLTVHPAGTDQAARREIAEQLATRAHDSTVIKIDSARSPVGAQGQKYLASGVRVSMRMWEREAIGDAPESERDYEVVGYVLGGEAELHIEGQMVRLEPGDSYVVPRKARHRYRILAPFTAIEATSPPAEVHGRDELRLARARG
jgi:nucleotide-binding universal stress UspA family protein/quercetin dioxygenase-like cupin family protein